MLEFNPYFRRSAAELLKSPVFDDIRDPSMEQAAPRKLELRADKSNYDYTEEEWSVSDSEAIELLLKEQALLRTQ